VQITCENEALKSKDRIMKSIKTGLVLTMMGLGLVMANATFAQTTPDQGYQNATKQRNQSREQVRDPAATGGQQQKQQRNQSGRNQPADQSQGQKKGQGNGSGQRKGKGGGRG
jgi:hypothetical protein